LVWEDLARVTGVMMFSIATYKPILVRLTIAATFAASIGEHAQHQYRSRTNLPHPQ
jgi:hypothetical protein